MSLNHIQVNVYGINGAEFGKGAPSPTYGSMSFPTSQVFFENYQGPLLSGTYCYGSIVVPRADGDVSSYNPVLRGARYHVIQTAAALATLVG